MGIKIAIWVCHQGAMRYMWQLVGHLVLPKGTAPDENSSFDAHGYWELLHVCYGIFLHKVDKQNLTNCDTAVRYELNVATAWASVAAMAHGSRWELVVNAHEYCKLLCVPYAIFLHQSCRLNAIFMLRFGPSLAFDQFKFLGSCQVMHHATTAVLWLQCPISFILCCVHVWANLMPCGHQNSNLGLSPGYDELHVATGWASVAAMAHGSRWELACNCKLLPQISVRTMCNLSTSKLQTECHIHAEIWPITGIWPIQIFGVMSSDAPCHDCCLVIAVSNFIHFVLRTCVSKFNALWASK